VVAKTRRRYRRGGAAGSRTDIGVREVREAADLVEVLADRLERLVGSMADRRSEDASQLRAAVSQSQPLIRSALPVEHQRVLRLFGGAATREQDRCTNQSDRGRDGRGCHASSLPGACSAVVVARLDTCGCVRDFGADALRVRGTRRSGDAELEQLLEGGLSEAGRRGGHMGAGRPGAAGGGFGARVAARILRTTHHEQEISIGAWSPEDCARLVEDVLGHLGSVVWTAADGRAARGVIGAGWLDMNPAVVDIHLRPGGRLIVHAAAKEGPIRQRTAEGAAAASSTRSPAPGPSQRRCADPEGRAPPQCYRAATPRRTATSSLLRRPARPRGRNTSWMRLRAIAPRDKEHSRRATRRRLLARS
jgi:hypothetical protein